MNEIQENLIQLDQKIDEVGSKLSKSIEKKSMNQIYLIEKKFLNMDKELKSLKHAIYNIGSFIVNNNNQNGSHQLITPIQN